MKTKIRLFLPAFLILLIIAGACVGGWLWYDSNIDRSGWLELQRKLGYVSDADVPMTDDFSDVLPEDGADDE